MSASFSDPHPAQRSAVLILLWSLAGCSFDGGGITSRDAHADLRADTQAIVDLGPRPDGPSPDGPSPDGPGPDGPGPDGPGPDHRSTDGLRPDASIDSLHHDSLPGDTAPPAPGTWQPILHGSFTMGSDTSKPCQGSDGEQHKVTLTHDFLIQTTEITQAQFQSLMSYNPSGHPACPNCPVDSISWHEAAAYCNALSRLTGHTPCYTCKGSQKGTDCQAATSYLNKKIYDCPGFRLPTEAEWEYAYRAETSTAYYNGGRDTSVCGACDSGKLDAHADAIAWYCSNSDDHSHPVAQKAANTWNLYDMAGNVGEWCHDYYGHLTSATVTDPWGPSSGSKRVFRPGTFEHNATHQSAAYRWGNDPTDDPSDAGARCVRTISSIFPP